MLPPTSPRLLQSDAVPYFLWDTQMTVAELRCALRDADIATKDELVARILREANTRDVWLFLDWHAIEDAWPRIRHRLGRNRPVWEMLVSRRHEVKPPHDDTASAG
jgi:hypothetical protein